MQLGMIGLGRMGANMVRRLIKGGHQCVVFDMSLKAVEDLEQEKAVGSSSLTGLNVSMPTSSSTRATRAPTSSTRCNSSGVKWSPAVGAAAERSSLANIVW